MITQNYSIVSTVKYQNKPEFEIKPAIIGTLKFSQSL